MLLSSVPGLNESNISVVCHSTAAGLSRHTALTSAPGGAPLQMALLHCYTMLVL